jgi:hypothetical protein
MVRNPHVYIINQYRRATLKPFRMFDVEIQLLLSHKRYFENNTAVHIHARTITRVRVNNVVLQHVLFYCKQNECTLDRQH